MPAPPLAHLHPYFHVAIAASACTVSLAQQCDSSRSSVQFQPTNMPSSMSNTPVNADECASDSASYGGRPSDDLSDADHDILESEDEREKLLTRTDGASGIFGRKGAGARLGPLSQSKEMEERKRGGSEEERALMYEMEEGVGALRTSRRRRGSEESDEQRLRAMGQQSQVGRLD